MFSFQQFESQGAAIVRMLQKLSRCIIFPEIFSFLYKIYAYSNAKTEDLWAVIETEPAELVTMLMNSWTKQRDILLLQWQLKMMN